MIVVFLEEEMSSRTLRAFRWIVNAAHDTPVRCVVVIQSVSLHFRDPNAIAFANVLRDNLKSHVSSLTIIRTGFVVNLSSATSLWFRRLSGLCRLLPSRMTSTFIDGARLFSIIDEEVEQHQESWESAVPPTEVGLREITILGQRRPWRDVAMEFQSNGLVQKVLQLPCAVISLLGIPWLFFWAVVLAGKIVPSLRQFHFHTLQPRSVRELISLYNRHNCSNVQIAGYNNGVNHFGWKYPNQTVVLTTSIPGDVRLSTLRSPTLQRLEPPDATGPTLESQATFVTVDSGLTLNHCIQELNKADREFYVVPNYSWISMGTLFFVPVHGSGSRVSTLGDTIEHVLLYDGDNERYVEAHRGDDVFRDAMYDRKRHWLLLNLTLQVKPKSKYFVRGSKMENPSAEDIQNLFNDPEASNVEIRKNQATSTAIDVSHYYIDTNAGGSDTMELPRDGIGRIWDRLEATPVVSTLFHWFVRTFAFHVELFLNPEEFAIFWKHHQSLPVSKIQLRRVLKDGLTHSACEHDDCISADLFMTRRNRDVFCRFVATHLPNVRSNPGKQSL
ncbi:MAG: hypothetical protein H7Z17_01265 [Fuerstia sp.]|nr:hypothetical protein [Fuerstiella sp.]